MAIRILPGVEKGRVETGAVQFGDDWPGLFIRGDNAMKLMLDIRCLLQAIPPLDDPQAQFARAGLAYYADLIAREVLIK